MGAHIAERSLLLGCLVALVIPAYSLKCHTCVGSDNGCSPTEVTCPGDNDKCSTTALYVDSFPCKVQKVFKGCINSTKSSQKISISPNDRITLSLQQRFCDSDLCNTKGIPGPNTTQNDLYCHSCISPGSACNSDTMKTMRCMGEQKLCVDMKVVGSFGDISDVNIKGCGEIPSCTQNLVFSSQTSSVSVQCCNENFCNSGTDSKSEDKTPNGLQCYSCNTLDGSSCSTESVVKAQCYGALTSCLEIEGTFVKDGQTLPTVIKGCATPSICNVPILPLLQKLGTPTVKCCNESLCNSQYSESGLQASGYLPVGNASPGTGNNTAGSGNSSIAGSSGSSSLVYINSGNGTGMTNEWSNSNNYSNHNNAMPVGYTNIHGNNYSPFNGSSSNGTRIGSEWLDTVVYYSPGDNDSSVSYAGPGGMNGWGNSSNSNMTEHVGHANINGNNSSTTSYTSTGNGTGLANDISNNNNSKPNTSVPGGYTNMSGSNNSSTSYGSSGNGTGIINSNNSNHSMGIPEGYANVPGGNGSSTSYASPGHGTEISNDNSSLNYGMLVPGANVNVPGSNGSSTSYTSSSNGTGMTNEWVNSNGSYHDMASPGGNYGSFNSNGSSHFSDSNHSSNFMIPNNGPTSGNISNYGGPWDSIESYLNHISSGENNNGSHPNISSWMHEFLPGGSSDSNKTGWIFGSNYDPNMMTNNNDSSSYYNNIQNFLSKLNGSIHSNDSQKINEWIQKNSFFSNLMPPGINNGSGYNVNSMFNRSLSDYFKSLGISWNNSNIPNIPSMFPSVNNGPLNISNIGSGWSNIMYNPNVKNPHANGSGPIPYNIGSYGNIQIPNLISPGSPNNSSTNTNGIFWGSGSNGQPNNPNDMIPGGYSNGYNNGNEHNSDVIPSGGSNPGAGNNMGHENINNSSHNSNMMVPGVGSGGSSNGGASTDGNGNVYNTNLSGHNTDVLIPGRSTNDSTSDGANNGSGSKNGTMSNSATTFWAKSGHFVIFSALALLVLN
ncbi:uncharacterized protein LOC143770410 isoform X2 [Ranitomeya variabilis]|uniref:uncharacterized protein LOC143770410 isoform X2 n=1 Tax=Ranitomeya variabilis TaxID=490064 RepID=UPI0040578847